MHYSLQDTLESKNDACRDFFGRLNESLAVWGSRLPVDARYESLPSICENTNAAIFGVAVCLGIPWLMLLLVLLYA